MESEDLMDAAIKEFVEGQNLTEEVVEQEEGNVEQEVAEEIVEQKEEIVEQKPTDNETLLARFNELSGGEFDNIDKIKDFADKYKKYPEIEKQLEVMPELLEIMGKMENPLNYFKDETAFKVNEISKDPKYAGKEVLIDKVLRSNLSETNDVDVISIASQLKAKEGVRNPLRAELRSMGLDPDEVLDDYDSLDDDTKDLLKIKADQFRDELPTLGKDVKVPTIEGTVLERVLNEKKAAKEDLAARREKLMPVSETIVSEIKDLEITKDFSFKLELTPDQIKSYAKKLTEAVLSGEHNISTEEGKQKVYGELIKNLRNDNFDKIVASLGNAKTSQTEEAARRKFNNETPLSKNEPNDVVPEEKHPMQRAAEEMISQGY